MATSGSKNKENKENYFKIREEVTKAKLSNSVTQDKAIFALSSAFLGFSITLISNQASSEIQIIFWIIACSWVFFGMSIITTLLSFRVSQRAQDEHLKIAEAFYLNEDLKALDKQNKPANTLQLLNWASLIIFCFGVVFTIVFAVINLTNHEGSNMTKEQKIKEETITKLVEKEKSTDFAAEVTPLILASSAEKVISSPNEKGADVTSLPKIDVATEGAETTDFPKPEITESGENVQDDSSK